MASSISKLDKWHTHMNKDSKFTSVRVLRESIDRYQWLYMFLCGGWRCFYFGGGLTVVYDEGVVVLLLMVLNNELENLLNLTCLNLGKIYPVMGIWVISLIVGGSHLAVRVRTYIPVRGYTSSSTWPWFSKRECKIKTFLPFELKKIRIKC